MLPKFVEVDVVLFLNVPHEVIIERIKNRWVHAASGRTYSYDYNPPKVLGYDNITGEPLSKREDDNVEVVKNRLDKFAVMTEPLLSHYNKLGMLKEFSGTESDVIYPPLKSYIESLFKI